MKKSIGIFNKITGLVSLLVFLSPFLISYAQSGRVIQTPPPTTVQTPTPDIPPQRTERKPAFVIDSAADKYKFVVAPSYDGKLRFLAKEKAAQTQTRHSSSNNFIRQLNLAGEQGYKLVSALDGYFALVKLDEVQYEYEWFETSSSVRFAKNGFEEKLKEAAGLGFRVVNHSLLGGSCTPIDSDNPAMGENCEYLDMYLAERLKAEKRPVEQILIGSVPGWGAKPSDALELQIADGLVKGFYPVNIFSAFEILLEKAKDEIPGDKPDVQIVRSDWGKGNVEDKVNELAKQGYRLAMTSNRIAVMYRNKETAQIPVAYVWLKANKKSFEAELAGLQEKGAVYKTTYPSERGTKDTLIFEYKRANDGSRTEFKILKLKFEYKEDKMEKKVYITPQAPSLEALKTMNKLVKEGFEVRDLFDTDEVGIILEKVKY